MNVKLTAKENTIGMKSMEIILLPVHTYLKLLHGFFVTTYVDQDNPDSDLVTPPVLYSNLFCFE